MARTEPVSPRSTRTAVAAPPEAEILPATACAPSKSRSATTVCAPSAATRSAVAAPMPDAAPVIMVIFPSSLPMSVPPVCARGHWYRLHGRELVQQRPQPGADGPDMTGDHVLRHPGHGTPEP